MILRAARGSVELHDMVRVIDDPSNNIHAVLLEEAVEFDSLPKDSDMQNLRHLTSIDNCALSDLPGPLAYAVNCVYESVCAHTAVPDPQNREISISELAEHQTGDISEKLGVLVINPELLGPEAPKIVVPGFQSTATWDNPARPTVVDMGGRDALIVSAVSYSALSIEPRT